MLENPKACSFDPKVLECKAGADDASCLTPAQVTAARALYQPLKHASTGKLIFTGLEPGSEMGWSTFGGAQPFAPGTQMYQFMVFKNPAWDYKTLNFGADMTLVDSIEKGNINAMDPNLQPFLAALFALVLLSEPLSAWQIAGGALIGTGILLAGRRETIAAPPE